MHRHLYDIALHGDVADDLVDMADRIRSGVMRGVVHGIGRLHFRMLVREQRDGIGGQPFAVRRHQRGRMSAREIAGDDEMLAVVAMEMQVQAGTLKRRALE
jgi:hypothetical protein